MTLAMKGLLTASLICLSMIYSCSQKNSATLNSNHKYTNELINESSPYLLQHAHNPVNWRAWNDETLELAKREDKLLLISIGYAACHWCHVMEHESFEDEEVAKLMNDNFICIKIDREERPDIDDIYMTACNLINGRGGWPLNAIALPDGRPVFAGTYYPKDDWSNILENMVKVKTNTPERLNEAAENITAGIADNDLIPLSEDQDFNRDQLDFVLANLMSGVDYKMGGNDRVPRFPKPNNFDLILQYHWLSGNDKALEAINVTLTQMAYGGIYDQIGGGFARYSVDGKWKVPHFEKMLYDNSQLIGLYADAYKQTKDPFYKHVVEQSVDFVNRELKGNEPGYYSSLDADSEGVEGKFYVWKASELDSLLGDDSKIYKDYFSVTPFGNWEHSNILHITKEPSKIAAKHKLSISELGALVAKNNQILFTEREKRIRPGLDDKILCSWNALMVDGLLKSYEALGDKKYYDQAVTTIEFILKDMRKKDGSLYRNYKNGKATINAFLDDYALLIQALIRLYQSDFNPKWLDEATTLSQYVLDHYGSEDQILLHYTSDLDPPLIVRKTEIQDNAIPASNSVMATNLLRLGTINYNTEWIDLSKLMLAQIKSQLDQDQAASFYSNWVQLYLNMVQNPFEIAIVGENAEELRKELSSNYLGNSLLLGSTSDSEMSLLKDKYQEDQTLIYVCQNKTCKFPVESVEKALKLMVR